MNLKILSTKNLLAFLSVLMFVYHMIYTQYLLQGTHRHVITHLGLALLIIFLTNAQLSEKKVNKTINLSLTSLAFIVLGYLWIYYEELIVRQWFSTDVDIVVGLLLILVCYIACIRSYGIAVPLVAMIFIIYPFFGSHLPEPFYSISYSIPRTINNLTTSLSGGIFDVPLVISSRYLFLVLCFGFLLNGLGATKFFLLFGKLFQHRLRSGFGLISVISSAGVGSVVGCGAANTIITGSFTLPAMINNGYKREFAAAIEATSSIGGQILPPIMGFIAFVMVGYTGIPYRTVIGMALIPAVMYFTFVGLHIHLVTCKLNYPLPKKEKLEKEEVKEMFRSLYLFMVPFTVLIVLIVLGYSITFAIFWAIISVLSASIIRKDTRPSLSVLIKSIVEGVQNGAAIAAMCAVVGLIITSLNMSGMGVKLTSSIEAWSGGNLLIALLIIYLICIIMGTTGVATAAYILVAIFAVPALIRVGLEFEVAHFFAMYPTIFTFITPPVAIAVLVASRLAGANYMKASFEAVRIATSGFLIPIIFVYAPVLLMRKPNSVQEGIFDVIATLLCLLSFQVANVGFMFTNLSWPVRFLLYATGSILLYFIMTKNLYIFIPAFTIFSLMVIVNYKSMLKKREAVPAVV